MENIYKLLLLEQLKLTYPNFEMVYNVRNRDEILLKNIPFEGIEIEISGRLDIYMRGYTKIDYEVLSNYFIPKLKFEDCRIFYNSRQLNIYLDKKFTNNIKGNFEKSLWTLKVMEYFIEKIKYLINELLKGETI